MSIQYQRKPEYPVNDIFVNRWSPRAMSGEEISEQELMSLFEAARWAPSSSNNQHWRFIYAKRNTNHWQKFFDLLNQGNQEWCIRATVLIVVVSKTTFDFNNKPARTHSYDTGAAWENLALQGSLIGLVVHGMQGFDYNKAKEVLRVPDDYQVEAMIAVGKPGKKEDLSEKNRNRESPSSRKSVKEIAFEGEFRN